MILKILFILLPFIANSLIFQRLSTLGQRSIKSNDYVYSTLGYFRLSIEQKSCQLKIESFDEQVTKNYNIIGFFPKNKFPQCQQLIFNESGLFTQKGRQFFVFKKQLSQNQSQQELLNNIKETFLTIDDTGIIRLQSIFSDQRTRQKWITTFKTPQRYIYASNNKIISNLSSLSIIKSNGNWGFSASKGQFRIFNLADRSKIIRYKFLPFILSTNIFKDWNDFTTPLLNFQGLKYESRCGISKQISFRSPFVFLLNTYWPQLRILDQEGYQLFNMRFPSVNCIKDIGVDKLIGQRDCISWLCPPQTFQLNGKCLTKCPAPYFHQIKSHGRNRCVLICEAGSFIDNKTNVCTCTQRQNILCPKQLISTPFGCLCKNGSYFFNFKENSNLSIVPLEQICLKRCPIRYFEHMDGICVSCPVFCLKCAVTNSSISYLKCLQCEEGFQVTNFHCRKKCQKRPTDLIISFSPYCELCKIRNCKKCKFLEKNNEICLQCLLPFSLFNNTCINNCPKNTILHFINDSSFECLPIQECSNLLSKQKSLVSNQCKNCLGRDLCFQNCEESMQHFFHNKSKCFCVENNISSFVQGCNFTSSIVPKTPINYNNFLENNPCPTNFYYYNFKTNECLKCPFGCLTCVVNQKCIPECTSCVQNYYLSIYDSSYCQRQTSLAYCYEFNRNQKYCFTWDEITDLFEKDYYHISCRKQNPNCFQCMYKSQVYCKFCQYPYFLYEGKCVKNCPQDFYPYRYQRVCLKKVIKHCKHEQIEQVNYLINSNSNTQFTEGYRYFTSKFFTQIQNQNDPIGLIFVYYGYLKRRIQGERMSTFTHGIYSCKICDDGYGLTSQGLCQKCQANCQVCIYSYTLSCVRCHPFYYLSEFLECLPKKLQERPCLNGQYRAEDGICTQECLQFKKLTSKELFFNQNQKIINCTLNCPQSMKIMKNKNGSLFCVQNDKKDSLDKKPYLFQLQQISDKPLRLISSCFRNEDNKGFCILSTSSKIKNLTKKALKLSLIFQSSSRLLQMEEISSEVTLNEDIIVINNLKVGVLRAVFSTEQFANPQNNEYLANSVYGLKINDNGSVLDQILSVNRGMHVYSRLIVILFLIVAVINFGKGLDYSVDNVFITMGTAYLYLTASNISIEKGYYYFYGWLYGFSWSLGLQMFSDPRSLIYKSTLFEPNFIQKSNGSAHFLLFIDDNLIRNCWSIFILLFITIGFLVISWIFTKLFTHSLQIPCQKQEILQKQESQATDKLKSEQVLQNQKQVCQDVTPKTKQFFRFFSKIDFDHFSKIKAFGLFVIENCILALTYYGLLQISSQEWKLASTSQLTSFKVLAWFLLIAIFFYFIVRSYTNFTAGIYLLKRILIGFALFINPPSKGQVSTFLSLLFVEIIFIGFRLLLQFQWQVLQIFGKIKQKILRKMSTKDLQQNLEIKQVNLNNQKINYTKEEQIFNFYQKAVTSNKNLPNIQSSEMIKNSIKNLPKLTTKNKQKLDENQSKDSQSLLKFMSYELRIVLIEQLLIIIVYLMLAVNSIMAQVCVFLIFLILMAFLIALLDDIIINLIEYVELNSGKISDNNSLIGQINKKINKNQEKYFLLIRNNFDFQKDTLSSTITTQFSSSITKQRKSSFNSMNLKSII